MVNTKKTRERESRLASHPVYGGSFMSAYSWIVSQRQRNAKSGLYRTISSKTEWKK